MDGGVTDGAAGEGMTLDRGRGMAAGKGRTLGVSGAGMQEKGGHWMGVSAAT
jgi:hypothetical protein